MAPDSLHPNAGDLGSVSGTRPSATNCLSLRALPRSRRDRRKWPEVASSPTPPPERGRNREAPRRACQKPRSPISELRTPISDPPSRRTGEPCRTKNPVPRLSAGRGEIEERWNVALLEARRIQMRLGRWRRHLRRRHDLDGGRRKLRPEKLHEFAHRRLGRGLVMGHG